MKIEILKSALRIIISFIIIIVATNILFIYIIFKLLNIYVILAYILVIIPSIFILIRSSRIFIESLEEKVPVKRDLTYLSDDEREIFELIETHGGRMLQNRIVNETGYTKVKVSRIITSLEKKGFVEKRRKGVTNEIIIIK